MKNKQENLESESFNKYNGEEAYLTLVNWVKSVPNAIKEIEENGSILYYFNHWQPGGHQLMSSCLG